MGYRSSYQLLVEAPKAKVEAFLTWLNKQELLCKELEKKQSVPKYYGYTVGETFENIRQSYCKQVVTDADKGLAGAVFGHEYWKCYDPWDLVMDQIEDYCTNEDVAFAYGRIGESMDDMEFRDNDLGLYVRFVRGFSPPFE